MKTPTKLLVLILLLLLAACSPAATEPAAAPETETMANNDMTDDNDHAMADDTMADDEMMDDAMDDDTMSDDTIDDDHAMADDEMMDDAMDDDAMADDAMDDDAMSDDTDEMMAAGLPQWQQITLTDVRTNETFTLADFAGKTVYVEPMATWCSNCRRQLNNVREAHAQLNSDDIIFVGLSVETNLDNATLAEYTVNEGFDWPFAIATPEMVQSLAEQFGRTVANPPSTPHFIIWPDNSLSELSTGFESAEELIGRLQG